jgi:exodeoxyribonuclease III
MRLVAWNCNMALHRKLDALRRLAPDIAVVSECACPERLRALAALDDITGDPIWIGDNPNKGLAVLAFNGYRLSLAREFHPTLRHLAPVHITGPAACNLLAVWAQNVSGGNVRKRQAGPLRRGLKKYKSFLSDGPAIVAGDFNNNVIWHKPGYWINHGISVAILESYGLVSAYHARTGEQQGEETMPTLYWRDRRKDGPTYHIDYVFLPRAWLDRIRGFDVGSFEEWCGSGLSDHVPVVADVDVDARHRPPSALIPSEVEERARSGRVRVLEAAKETP